MQSEIESYAQKLYDELFNGNRDSIAMFDFTFYCSKEKFNIYPIIYIYKLHAEVLEVASKKINEARK